MTDDQRADFCRGVGVASAEVDGELVLISPLDRRCFSLNGTAAAIWEFLPSGDGDRVSLNGLVDRLVDRYAVDSDTCAAEVARLLQAMAGAGVVSAHP